jgi:methyl-accepting chemotaxis protein
MVTEDCRHSQIIVDRRLHLRVFLRIAGYLYAYLVLFAILANLGAIKTVVFGNGPEEKYLDAVYRLQVFATTFVIPLVLTFVAMCIHGMYFSRRLAGPLVRFKQSLRRIKEGDLSHDLQIRGGDHFQDLCREVNEMLGQLRTDFVHFRTVSQHLAEAGESLASEGDLSTDAQARLFEITNASTRLRQLVDGYQLEDGESREKEREPEPAAVS